MQAFLKGLKQVDESKFSYGIENTYVLDEQNQLTHLAISGRSEIDWVAICNNPTLEWLALRGCNLSSLPESIGQLQNLKKLDFVDNKLVSLPESFGLLCNLQVLRLELNNLTSLPKSIGQLQNLYSLILRFNYLTSLPESLKNLKKLLEFALTNSPITQHLKGIEEELHPQELITYLLEVQDKNTKPLNEAKVLVVGDERVGKTSLINRLLGNPHNPNQKSTPGIDIQNHKLSNDIRVNIWDFAGQEITHQTHQFFLSTRSLYLYVLDSQKEDNDSAIYHWLSVIKANGGDSPIIIVVNKRDLNAGYIFDLNRYKDEFNIVDVLYLSAENDDAIDAEAKQKITHSIANLTSSIEQHVAALEDIKFPLPQSWAKVKQQLEDMSGGKKDYIESDDYETLCRNNGIDNEQLQDTLLTILNQIGTIVTYKDNDRLSVMQIINPLWVTNGVYKIIRSPLVTSSALLTQAQFKQIFSGDSKYKTRHYNWLKDLLNQFELSFSIDDTSILIPSKLNPNQPDFKLADFQTGLNFRYRYHNLLKKSVISQFIVKMKDYIAKDGDKYWQRGVFLHHGDCRAVVISDEEKKTIVIAINSTGRAAKELLSIIRHTLRVVNGENLPCDEQVPLLLNHQVVGYEDYDHLVECEEQGDDHIRLKIVTDEQKSHRFAIKDLLDGYRIKDDTRFDYDKLTKDLVTISQIETENGRAISDDSEDQTNDRYRSALLNREYNLADQSRGGKSKSGDSAGERDFVIRNSQTGVAESVIEAFILKGLNATAINDHYNKLVNSYDTTGNRRNFILVYVKTATTAKFAELWQKYQEHFVTHFDGFEDTSDNYSDKSSVKTGITSNDNKDVFHIFVHFPG